MKITTCSPRERGSSLVLVAGVLIVLAGFAVLAVDIGRIFIVRNEMQNAADAAALAGANCLTKQSSGASTTDCTSVVSTVLNWDRAMAKSADQLNKNSASEQPLSSTDSGHAIVAGYWDLMGNAPSGGTLSTAFAPLGAYDKPAVKVTLTKAAGMNGGPIVMLTRMMFGGSDVPMTVSAVAVLSSPGGASPGTLIPQVINKCMYDKFWDATAGKPVIYTGTPADPYHLSVVGQPWELRIGSAYHYDTCTAGQWTTFDQDLNSQSAISSLIANGNPTKIGIGDLIWISPGTKNASYKDLRDQYPSPPGADVTVIVVDTADLSNKGQAQVVAFAGFHIDDIQFGGNDKPEDGAKKFIQGHFTSNMVLSGSSGIGPFYGTYTPPRLAKTTP